MPKPSLCPKCKKHPRRAPGLNCNPCEAEWKRNARAKQTKIRTEAEKIPRFTRALDAKRYIVTSAQNATPVHAEFFAALQVATKFLKAELVVIPFRYKNPTSQWSQAQQNADWWGIGPVREANGEENPLRPYLHNTRKKLCDSLVLAADVKIQPTAVRPLSGFEALTGAESTILGSPKMQLVSVPSPAGRHAKILTTTGACTVKNYTDTKAGKLGEFHHFLGAIIVEVDGSDFYGPFQINADRKTGEFIHHEFHYSPKGVRRAPPALGLVLGDTHVRSADPSVDAATFGPGGIVEALNPEKLAWNDTLDFYSGNHHHAGNPFIAAAKARAGVGNVRAEVEQAVDYVRERTKGRESYIIPSNHDDMFARWLRATDWRLAGSNTEFLLETALAVYQSARWTPEHGAEYVDAFGYWVNKLRKGAAIRCLPPKQTLKIAGIDISHGHRGPDGAKVATMKNMARVGAKVIDGHGHAFGIEEGHYRVATSSYLEPEYVEGPSSWSQGHCGIDALAKRSLYRIVNGKWRLPPPALP